MADRPDSDAQSCRLWTEGRPGDGVMAMDMRGWRPPFSYRIDEQGHPARYDRLGSCTHRLTAREDVPRLRARDVLSACCGDGHYECGRCIFFREFCEQARRG